MKAELILLIACICTSVLGACGLSPSCVKVSATSSLDCQSGKFVVDLTNTQNVPKYSFFLTTNSSNASYNYGEDPVDGSVYKFQLAQISELAGTRKTSTLPLSTLDWSLGPIEIVDLSGNCTNTETQFNITCTGGYWDSFTLVNHLSTKSDTTTLKFDIILTNYLWQDASSDHLAISFTYSSAEAVATYKNSTYYALGSSYISINPVAHAYVNLSNPSVRQTVSVAFDSSGKTEILYSRFNGSLIHDPTIGVIPKASTPTPTPTVTRRPTPSPQKEDDGDGGILGLAWWVWLIIGVGVIGVIIAIIIGVIIYAIRYRRRTGYVKVRVGEEARAW